MKIVVASARPDASDVVYASLASGRIAGLPEPVRALLLTSSDMHMVGALDVRHGRGWLAHAVARLMRLPSEGRHQPVRLSVVRRRGYELWQRRFGDREMNTRQYLSGSLLAERAGPLELLFEVQVNDQVLVFASRRATLRVFNLSIGTPKWIAPVVFGQMTSHAPGDICAVVAVATPLTGEILRYSGTMREVSQ